MKVDLIQMAMETPVRDEFSQKPVCTIAEAVGERLLTMEERELEHMEGNIGQLVLAQAMLFLKRNFVLRECHKASVAATSMIEAAMKVRALGASAQAVGTTRRRL